MADISLSKAVRSNLLSLKGTADMMATTQNRLSTGNKVNSALDNPSSWFTAQGLSNRASDLGSLLDSMANGVKTLEAADNGLSAMTKTLESMQSTLRQARQDKSFQTASFDVTSTLTSGALTFSNGSVGSVGRSVDLANTALTNTALGMSSVVAEDAGDAAVASTFTGVGGADLAGGEGGAIVVTVGDTDYDVVLLDTDTMETAADKINAAVGSNVANGAGAQMVLTNADGTGISVADEGANANGTTAALFGAPATVAGSAATSGVNTITWPGEAVEVNQNAKITFTASIDGEDQTIEIKREDVLKAGNGDGTIDDAAEFAAILSSKIEGATATATGNAIALTSATTGTASTVELTAATVTGTAYTADELVQTINANEDLKGFIRASNDNGKLRIENQSTQELDIVGASGGKTTGVTTATSEIAGNSVRAGLAEQFNELRDQLDKLADDASFNGINLLRGDKLAITFNETGTSAIDIQTEGGDTINSANLGVSTTLEASDLDSDDNIDGELAKLKSALNEVRSQASSFGSNLSIVENRQTFTKSMINTLEDGAGNLTLADMNTEAANLLALQTRQSLSQNSLSLASQADQSILQLIR
jgi:flagellin-like hook-associated protein FlgL